MHFMLYSYWTPVGLRAGLLIKRFGVQILSSAEIWFEISAPPVPLSHLGCEGYTDHTLSVGR